MNKEKVKENVCTIKECGRPTHKESKCCIFHASAEEKTEEEFKIALKKYVEEIKEEDKNSNFNRFIFIGDIDFEKDLNITIFKNTDFAGATFEREAWFLRGIFKGDFTDFNSATFKGHASFAYSTFEGHAYFSGVTFKDSIGFENANFLESAHFSAATFNKLTSFYEATIWGEAEFDEVNFKEDTSFFKVTFKRDVYFRKATFLKEALFEGAIFNEDMNFQAESFAGGLILEKVSISRGKKLNLKVENNKVNVSFERACLENTYLDLDLGVGVLIDFTDTLLKNTKIEKNQIENRILQEEQKEFSEAKEVYLLLKNNFHSIGKYENESWASKKEKDMERKDNCHFKTLHKWLWSCFLNGIFGYGEQPGKVILSAILIILIFTFLFMISGVSSTGIGGSTSKYFLDCVYFSTVTFTTLGYGDFRPLEGWGRIFAGTEAFIGAFMMALFVYTFARRTGGR